MKLPNGLIEFMEKNEKQILAELTSPSAFDLSQIIYELMPKKPGALSFDFNDQKLLRSYTLWVFWLLYQPKAEIKIKHMSTNSVSQRRWSNFPAVEIMIRIPDSGGYHGYFNGESYRFYRKELEKELNKNLEDCQPGEIARVIYKLLKEKTNESCDYPPPMMDEAEKTLENSDNLGEIEDLQREIYFRGY